VFGTKLVNPLGISSGLEKHGEIPTQLLALGLVYLRVALNLLMLCKELRNLFSGHVFPLLLLQNKHHGLENNALIVLYYEIADLLDI